MSPGNGVGELESAIETLSAQSPLRDRDAARAAVARLFRLLETGEVRAAHRGPEGWEAVEWVKRGILLAFRAGETVAFPKGDAERTHPFRYFDRDTLPLRETRGVEERVRIVPGGSSVRAGAYLGPNVVVMPPAFVNVGAWVGEGTMIDSHALVGSCAQIGSRVHVSAGAQIGGVLEPVGLRPVVIEDEVLVGGNTGVFEGVVVGRRAVLAAGVQITGATPLFDVVRGEVVRGGAGNPLTVPSGAVVVPGSRPASGPFVEERGIQIYAPVIVKYRDEKTDAATALEDVLR